MIFLPVLIFSSSPKLNFRMKTPVPIATAAAGVASFISQSFILEKALFSFETSLGVVAKLKLGNNIRTKSTIIKIIFKFF